MFDVSLVELAVIALVALLVLGPERLPRAARTVGLYVRKARQSWYGVRADIERELAADELKRSMERNKTGLQSSLGIDGLREELRGVQDDLRGRSRISPPRAALPPAGDDATIAAPSNEALPEQSEAGDSNPAAPSDGTLVLTITPAPDAAVTPPDDTSTSPRPPTSGDTPRAA